jgi:hypothetical protein
MTILRCRQQVLILQPFLHDPHLVSRILARQSEREPRSKMSNSSSRVA